MDKPQLACDGYYMGMDRLKQVFSVQYTYGVWFVNHAFGPDARCWPQVFEHANPNAKLLVLAEGSVLQANPHYANAIRQWIETISKPIAAGPLLVWTQSHGEATKQNQALADYVIELSHLHGLDRHSYLLAIGGGAFLDAVGLGAALAHRGIRLVRMPSTVLGQNDAGVGVKNAINRFGKKNFVGTFAPPHAVVNDQALLQGLPARERNAGLAEAIKVALIKDADFFFWLFNNSGSLWQPANMAHHIKHCAKLHLNHIAQGGDPFELGNARPLDYGHWAAHKLESLLAHQVLHGEAVAFGLLLDTYYNVLQGQLSYDHYLQLEKLVIAEELLNVFTNVALPTFDAVFQGLVEFQEHLGGHLALTMLLEIGKSAEIDHISKNLMQQAYRYLAQKIATLHIAD